ncbi:ethionine resistance protein [Scheffersomyces spartinae]|uniref:Ethionine resistance protein n=1 Tax=Scheffersomyces spartinae TaxID=45513 RepID=A0A9P7V5F0_9ASCO|nr:ethionine resistance protein [Scheffersomyces spartinae]KAG7191296.1 ethionine resistance protein [Scheffersomyces spartinae]
MSTTNERTHQFTHSNTQRRASVVYGSVGKGGLFIPQDFLHRQSLYAEEDEGNTGESQTLLGVSADSSYGEHLPVPGLGHAERRRSTVQHELIEEERQLLKDAAGKVFDSSTSDDVVAEAFEEAIKTKTIHDSTTAKRELTQLIKSSIPLVMTFLLQNSLSTVSVFTVGHLGATELAAVSMGAMTANITGYATIQGIATALDTLCPQAFGAKKYNLVGIYLQKCSALIFSIMIPVLFTWAFFAYELICLIVPDKETAKLLAVYLNVLTLGMPGYIFFECGKRFLQAQGIYHISTYVLLFAAPANLVMNVVLVKHWGYLGAPLAVSINYWLMAVGLLLATKYAIKAEDTPAGFHPMRCWGGLNVKEAFSGWGKLAGLAVPGLIMLEAEFLAFEILTLMASYLGTTALAAQSIGTTMASLTYQVPFAIGIASSTRIANYLGAELPYSAKKCTRVSLSFGLVISFVNFFALYIFQYQIARLFTDDEGVIRTVTSVMWLVAFMQVSDAMNANSAGCLRGQGQTKIGGIVNLLSYYIVGLPLSIYLSFYSPWKGSLHGLWIGSTVALTIIGSVQSYVAIFSDFDELVEDAKKRTSIEVTA